jgi:hypothetical protein
MWREVKWWEVKWGEVKRGDVKYILSYIHCSYMYSVPLGPSQHTHKPKQWKHEIKMVKKGEKTKPRWW